MKFLEQGYYVEINGSEYSVFDELNYRYPEKVPQGNLAPYVRRTTKITVFKELAKKHPETYETLKDLSWFNAYIGEVETGKERKTVSAVNDFLYDTDSTTDKLNSVIDALAQSMDTMSSKIDTLGKNSKLEEALLEGIISKGKDLAVEEIREELKLNLQQYIKETYGSLPDRLIITNKDVVYEKTGLFHEMFDKVLKLVNMKLPVMLTGGAGTGKNYMLEQVSEVLNLSFYYTSTITQEYKLTGFIDGGGKFHETEFYKAFTQGGIFMLDEIDASIPEALVILNGAIANGYFDFPIGREIAHENFRVVCAGNTVGLGADMVYTGRNVLDGATLDRFVLVEVDYDARIESQLCQDIELREFLYSFRKSVNKNKIQHVVGMRSFKYSYEMLVNDFDKNFIVKSVITKGLQSDDINVIKNNMNTNNTWYKYL